MKIIKYTKLKNNKYNLKLDNDLDIKLYDDVIVKYDLIRNKELDEKKLEEITNYNDELSAYYKALKYITTRLRTEKEIFNYLKKDYEYDIINKTINKLKKEKYLNNDIYLRCYIDDQVLLNNVGPNKIKDNLLKLGLYEEDINEYLNRIDNNIWLDKLRKNINKKIKTNHNYSINKLKEKILYDMSNQGFYKWMIEEVINESRFQVDKSLIKKEYNKLYQKLSKKYNGQDLKYQIRNKLLQKGFNYEEINDLLNEV